MTGTPGRPPVGAGETAAMTTAARHPHDTPSRLRLLTRCIADAILTELNGLIDADLAAGRQPDEGVVGCAATLYRLRDGEGAA